MPEVVVRELTPERLGDYLQFFDNDAFTDNPHWAGCYCMFYHFAGPDGTWANRTGAENRAEKSDLIRAGRAGGLLAYVDGRPVGWCNASRRTDLAALQDSPTLPGEDARDIGSIVCFLVAPGYRRQGIARELLDAACALFEHQGLRIAEAYARKEARSDAEAYHGTVDLYREAGFTEVREQDGFVLMRKRLGKTP